MVLRMPRPIRRDDSAVLQLKMRVPADVRSKAAGARLLIPLPPARPGEAEVTVTATVGKEFIKFSLRTHDPVLAKARHTAALSFVNAYWQNLRHGPRPLIKRERVMLAGALYRAFATGLEDDPGDSDLWAAVREANEFAMSGPPLGIYNSEEEARADALERRFGRMVDLILAREGIVTDAASRSELLRDAGRALTEAAEKLRRNAESDYRPDGNADRFPPYAPIAAARQAKPAEAGPVLTFDGLFDKWRGEAKPSASTVITWRGYVASFRAHVGHDDPRGVTKADVVAWKDALIASGLEGVRKGQLAAIKALFNYAAKNDLLPTNPTIGVTVHKNSKAGKRMRPYDDHEVARILALTDDTTHDGRRWLPWLLALSGARVGELAQLWGRRVVEIDGVWTVRIAPAEDGGSLKNEGSERTVPIHPAILERGFLAFVRSRGDGPLFYGQMRKAVRSTGGTGRHASKGVANHLATWIRENGFTDPRKAPNHAFRHWFKTRCQRLGILDSVADAIQGHASGEEADGYRHGPITTLAEAIRRIPVPTIPTSADTPPRDLV